MILIQDGRALVEIALPKHSDRVMRFAARELRRYLGAIGGAPPLLKEMGEQGPPVAEPAILLVAGDMPAKDKAVDGYTIQTRGRQLLLGGRNSRSVLYAVYDLLESLGCRFVEPGLEFVPKLRTVAVPPMRRTETAAFALRNIFRSLVVPQKQARLHFLDPDLFIPQIDWMAKRRLNHHNFYIDYYRFDLWEKHKRPVLDALLDRGFDLEVTHHSLHYFCPPDENHDFADWGPATYQRHHPDWYLPALECGPRGRWQTRVETPEVQEIVIRRYLDYVRRNPELKIVGLWPDDIPMNNPSRRLNPSDGYLQFWNRVANALGREFPDKRLGIIAYFELIKPPRKIRPASNTHCWYCPLERNFHYPLRDARNGFFRKPIKPWTRQLAPQQLGVFDYYGWSVPFIPYRAIMRDDLQLYRELGVGGVYAWSGFTHNLFGEDCRWALDFYCLAHLLWNPSHDLPGLEATWTTHVFGDAGPRVLDFLDFMRAAHRTEAKRGLAGYIFQDFAGDCRWISLNTLRQAQKLLAAARRKADCNRALRRIDRLEKLVAHGCTHKVERWPMD
ncbi:MAG: DUF4838 domain-containing protein [Verrucomicrobia bacterium]|nr:DUF4838 domain-containing protein [Verrucomicrobiota bacterium]